MKINKQIKLALIVALSTISIPARAGEGSGAPAPAGLSAEEENAYQQLNALHKKGSGYAKMMVTRPQTLGFSLADSPAGVTSQPGNGRNFSQTSSALHSNRCAEFGKEENNAC